MSRIGKQPITIAEGVEITVDPGVLTVKGSKGELKVEFDASAVSISIADGVLTVARNNDSKDARSKHGLYRTLTANAIEGVSKGYEKRLEIIGVGYRGAIKGNAVELNLGFSHSITHPIPEGVKAEFDKEAPNTLIVSGINKQLVGQVAAEIRSYRKPEPYKGKGIRYQGEYIYRKAGKSAAK